MSPHEPHFSIQDLPHTPVTIDTGTVELRRVDRGIVVIINGAESSILDMEDPTFLDFEYMQHMTLIADAWKPAPTGITALHLGGGACALPRAWAYARPTSKNKVVEIDSALSTYVREWFQLPRAPRLSIRVGEARSVIEQLHDHSYDVIVRDVFSGTHTPPTVASVEATQHYARVLQPDGLYLANVAAIPRSDQAGREIAAIKQCFSHVIAVAPARVARAQRRGNIVVAASQKPLDTDTIDTSLRRCPLPVGRVADAIMSSWLTYRPLKDEDPHPGLQ